MKDEKRAGKGLSQTKFYAMVNEKFAVRRRSNLNRRLIALCSTLVFVLVARIASSQEQQDIPFVPTTMPIVERMLELADVKKDDLIYDLGCGDGRILIHAAQKY